MYFKEIVEKTHDSICVLKQDNIIQYVNPAFCNLVGYSSEDLMGKDLGMVLPAEIARTHADIISAFVHKNTKESSVLGKLRKLELVNKSGEVIPVELIAFEVSPDASGMRIFVGAFRDLRERESLALEYNRLLYDMDKLGYMDTLTQLPNQKFIDFRMQNLLSQQPFRESIYGLIDIDGLTFINQKYSIETGDAIIKKVGSELRLGLPMKHIIARDGTFDFACIFTESSLSEVINLIETFRNQMSRKRGLISNEPNYCVTVSIGLTRIMNPSKEYTEYHQEAKAAITKAKQEGKNKLYIHGFY